MVLLLRNHEIRGLMHLTDYIGAVEDGYREIGTGAGAAFPRENLWIARRENATVTAEGICRRAAKPHSSSRRRCCRGWSGAGVQRLYTAGLPQRAGDLLVPLRHEYRRAGIAIMEVLYYDWLKTAAVSALAAKCLAPAGSAVLALFGTGRHARSQLYAISPAYFDYANACNALQPRRRQTPRLLSRKMSAELGP